LLQLRQLGRRYPGPEVTGIADVGDIVAAVADAQPLACGELHYFDGPSVRGAVAIAHPAILPQVSSGLRHLAPTRLSRQARVYLIVAAGDILGREEAAMAKTLIEIDERYLAAAQRELGTTTKKDTVNAALREVTAIAARRRDLKRLTSRSLPDLENEEVMRAAWQR
jgi:Arc/MetJ family transcription regulator